MGKEMICAHCSICAGCHSHGKEKHDHIDYNGEYIEYCPFYKPSKRTPATLCRFCAKATDSRLCGYTGKANTLPKGAAYSENDAGAAVTYCPRFERGLHELRSADMDNESCFRFIGEIGRQFADVYRSVLLDPFSNSGERKRARKAFEEHWLLRLAGIDTLAVSDEIRTQCSDQIERLHGELTSEDWERLQNDYPGQMCMLRAAKNLIDKYEKKYEKREGEYEWLYCL